MDDAIAHVETTDDGELEIRLNFGILAGRQATQAELEQLGHALVSESGDVSIVAEERLELSRHSEAELHQVRIRLEGESLDETLRYRLVALAERWARECAADRHADVTQL
jgi:hypothetical protein